MTFHVLIPPPAARKTAPAILLSLLLGACAVPSPMGNTPTLRHANTVASDSLNGPDGASWPQESWWRDYGDAQLTALIEEAIKDSPTLAEAQAKLRIAQGYARTANAALLPTLSASGDAGAIKQSYNEGIPPAFVPKGINSSGAAQLKRQSRSRPVRPKSRPPARRNVRTHRIGNRGPRRPPGRRHRSRQRLCGSWPLRRPARCRCLCAQSTPGNRHFGHEPRCQRPRHPGRTAPGRSRCPRRPVRSRRRRPGPHAHPQPPGRAARCRT